MQRVSCSVDSVSLNYEIIGVKGDCLQTSSITHTLASNKIVDHSDVVGASPVVAAPTTPSFAAQLQWIGQRQLQDARRNE